MKVYVVFLCLLSATISVVAADFTRLAPDFQPDFSPEISNTEGGLWMVMADAEDMIKHSPSRVNDEELNAYLKRVTCKLARFYCNDIRIYILRKPHFNASMAPNGMMLVWTGLLLRMRNEAQLASVLGHEIGHYLKRHSLKNFNDAKTKSSLLTFFTLGIAGSVAAGGVNADVGRSVINVTQFGMLASLFAHSRDAEREADKYGIQLLNDAQLDVSEAPKIWQHLIDENKAGDNDLSSGAVFFATHPDPGERVSNLQQHVDDISQQETTHRDKNQEEYWQQVGPFMPLLLEDELNLRQFEQTEYLISHLIDDGVQPGVSYYYLGELYRLRKNDGDLSLSLENYRKSVGFAIHPAEAHRSLGLIHFKDKKFGLAKEQFRKYLEMSPQAYDREMIEYYINFGS